jgi:hypothetical protein
VTPLERLYAEEIPTGTFGDAQPTTRRSQSHPRPWSATIQAQHRADLIAALDGWEWHDTYTEARRHRDQRRHLRAITPAA